MRLVPLSPELVAGPAPRLAAELRRLVARERPRVVHVTDTWAPALVAARLAGARRLLVTHHTPELPRHDNLAGRAWLVGTGFSTADLNVAAVLAWAFPAKLDLSKYPRVAEWLGRCTARPAFKG